MFSSRFSSVSVSVTPVRVVGQSNKRYRLMLSLDSLTTTLAMYLGHDNTVSTTSGFPINGYKAVYDWDVREHGDFVQREIWAISTTGMPILGVVEVMACDCESEAMLRDALGHSADDESWHQENAKRMLQGNRPFQKQY